MAQQNSNISEMWETCYKNLPKQTVSVPVRFHRHTESFAPAVPTHLWVKKCHTLASNTKLRLQLTIRTALVQDMSHDKEKFLHGKILKRLQKLINQIRPVLMLWCNLRGEGGKKAVIFLPKTSYKLGTDVKRGKQENYWKFKKMSHSVGLSKTWYPTQPCKDQRKNLTCFQFSQESWPNT